MVRICVAAQTTAGDPKRHTPSWPASTDQQHRAEEHKQGPKQPQRAGNTQRTPEQGLLWVLFVCFRSVLLFCARGLALRLGVCLLGFSAVACAVTPLPTIASLCNNWSSGNKATHCAQQPETQQAAKDGALTWEKEASRAPRPLQTRRCRANPGARKATCHPAAASPNTTQAI